MERTELLAIQFDEARRLLQIGSIPHLRLSIIITDNVAELLMHRAIQSEIERSRFYRQVHEIYRQLPSDIGGHRTTEDTSEESYLISETRIRKIERSFEEKVDFLVERKRIAPQLGPLLKKLHRYRNEVYHRDKIRRGSILPAALIYFRVACMLLESYSPGWVSYTSNKTPPGLVKYLGPESPLSLETRLGERIATVLLAELHIDGEVIKEALIGHLRSRVDEIRSALTECSDFTGIERQDIIRIAQLPRDTKPIPAEDLRRIAFARNLASLDQWEKEAALIEQIDDLLDMFAAFAAIEDDMEPLEDRIIEMAVEVDREIQLQVDIARGK
jgi:hypothetical protein